MENLLFSILSLPALLAFFVFTTLTHGTALLFVSSYGSKLEKHKKLLWQLHFFFNGILWFLLFALLVAFQFKTPPIYFPLWLKVLGGISIFTGLFLAIKSFSLLGINRAMGIRFFFPERAKRISSNIYRFLNNPMYDGFLLILIGAGFIFGIVTDFIIGFTSFILLNIFLASIENYEFKWNPF